ncbi:MAG: MFS transporter [Amphritea sp.]
MKKVWPLFVGLSLIGVFIGASGSLLGLRAAYEGFDTWVTGLIMSANYVGFLLGAFRVPKIIKRVGHIRAFAALTALSSVTILLHPLLIDPWVWAVMRLLTGFASCGIYIVVESWLNQMADKNNRGQLLALYMVTYLSGLAAGQVLLNVAVASSYELFSLLSVLISLAAIPILIVALPVPVFDSPASVNLKSLFRWAPSGVLGAFAIQCCLAMIFGMGAVYAHQRGFNTAQVASFMSAMILGGMLAQWPLGKLSDLLDRRSVIAVVASLACGCATLLAQGSGALDLNTLLLSACFGALCMPLLAIYQALTNDDLDRGRMVGASSTLLMVGGIGATAGPIVVSVAMDKWGTGSFFWCLALLCGLMAVYALYRRIFYPKKTEHQRTAFQVRANTTMGTVVPPDNIAD